MVYTNLPLFGNHIGYKMGNQTNKMVQTNQPHLMISEIKPSSGTLLLGLYKPSNYKLQIYRMVNNLICFLFFLFT